MQVAGAKLSHGFEAYPVSRAVSASRRPGPLFVDSGESFPSPEVIRFLELLPSGALVADLRKPDAPICYVNKAFETITGYAEHDALGRNCRYLQRDDREQPAMAAIRDAIARREETTVRLRNYRKDGQMFWNELKLSPLVDASGVATHYLGLMRDVTELKATRAELEYAATVDRLTGCLNRYSLTDELTRLASRDRVMLVKVDLIGFNLINSGYGHAAGDAMLTQIAARLQRIGADAVGRIGSNDFAIGFVLKPGDDGAKALASVQRVLAPRYLLPGLLLRPIDAQFGVGFVIGEIGDDGTSFIRRAGTAASQSKATNLRQPREYDSAAADAAERRLHLTSEIQQGIANDEFCYHYQPKVDLLTGAIIGAEALLRWRHPSGLRFPADFLDLADETGLIIEIGSKGFRQVAAFAGRLNAGRATPLTVAINLTPVALRQRDIVERAVAVLKDIEVDPRWLTVELTEGMMADGSQELIGIFRALREIGFGLSIDDFGTGYSSLRYLESFPISEIKIDQGFVRGMLGEPPKQFIVDAVISIGRSLDAAVVAEGVETEAEAQLLRQLGCTIAQGYLFGRPMPPDDFMTLVGQG